MPERRPADLRPPYALTPITKHVTVTEAVRRLLADQVETVDVAIVPVLHDAPPYISEDLLSEPVVFQRLSLVLYAPTGSGPGGPTAVNAGPGSAPAPGLTPGIAGIAVQHERLRP